MDKQDEENFQIALIELLGPEALAGGKLSFHDVARRFYRRGLIDGIDGTNERFLRSIRPHHPKGGG